MSNVNSDGDDDTGPDTSPEMKKPVASKHPPLQPNRHQKPDLLDVNSSSNNLKGASAAAKALLNNSLSNIVNGLGGNSGNNNSKGSSKSHMTPGAIDIENMMAVAAGATDVTTDDYDDVTEVGDAAAIRRQVGSHFFHFLSFFYTKLCLNKIDPFRIDDFYCRPQGCS